MSLGSVVWGMPAGACGARAAGRLHPMQERRAPTVGQAIPGRSGPCVRFRRRRAAPLKVEGAVGGLVIRGV